MKNKLVAVILATMSIGVTACSQKTESAKIVSPFTPTATLQELMVSVIDPNVDPIWNATSTVSTKEGTVEKTPQTDAEWTTLRNHALTLVEVSNLLVIEGRPVAALGVSTSTHAVELNPQDVQKLIETHRGDFINHAHALQEGAKLMLAAIDARNPEELARVGGIVDHACEQCHSQFWYPNDKRPTASLDLGRQAGSDLYMKMRNAT
ncbi:MAG: hypothetical protein V4445_00860 [Pseudomonadota bacterium]